MPRYFLEPAPRLLAKGASCRDAPRGNDAPIDYGHFWFDGYAVSIRLLRNGKLQAQRVVKEPGVDGVWQKLVYWLKTAFGAEGGRAWYLDKRDAADVIAQRWAEYRVASGEALVPQHRPDDARQAPAAGQTNLLALTSLALDGVIGNLGLRDQTALALTNKSLHAAMKEDLHFGRARKAADRIETLGDLKAVTAGYGLAPPRTNRLSLPRQVALLGALAGRLSSLKVHSRSSAARHLLDLASFLPAGGRSQAKALVLARMPQGLRAEVGAAMVRDRYAYAALAAALMPAEEEQGLVALAEAFLASAGQAANDRAARWDELLDALPAPGAAPAVTGRRLAALADCLGAIHVRSDRPADPPPAFEPAEIARWYKLQQLLERLPPEAGIAPACALGRCLKRFPVREGERAKAMALLEQWQGAAGRNHDQHVALSLALLGATDWSRRAEKWSATWDRIEQNQLLHHAAAAVRQLTRVPEMEGWNRVIAFCRSNIEAHPNACADMLLSFGPMLDMGGDVALESAFQQAALALLASGGPGAPLLRCSWLAKAEILAALRTHIPWPARAQALVQWLEPPGGRQAYNRWEPADLLSLQADLTELAGRIPQGNDPDGRPLCVRALTAMARRCDEAVLYFDADLDSALAVAEGAFALVRGIGGGDDTADAIAALAQLTNSIVLLDARKGPDPKRALRIDALLDRVWALTRWLTPAGRQAMLEALLSLKRTPPPPNDMRHDPHLWTGKTLLRAIQAVSDDLPDPARVLAELASADFRVDGRWDFKPRFGDLNKRIWTKAMALPDEPFAQVAERIAFWFTRMPAREDEARGWREARSAMADRVRHLPRDRYPQAGKLLKEWMGEF
jgi:hypothetical protein